VLTTDQKGAIAEAAIALEAIKLGVEVYRPVAEGGRFDMIFVTDERVLRVQCKWAPLCGDTVIVRTYSNRRAREGLRRRVYTADEIDAFAAYCPDLDRCYFLPIGSFEARTQVFLRVSPTRNNQRSLVNWAKDFEFAATLGRQHGAIAQLGERLLGMQKVAGSSPAGSMKEGAREHPRPVLFSVD
jgi:hypothetical protein